VIFPFKLCFGQNQMWLKKQAVRTAQQANKLNALVMCLTLPSGTFFPLFLVIPCRLCEESPLCLPSSPAFCYRQRQQTCLYHALLCILRIARYSHNLLLSVWHEIVPCRNSCLVAYVLILALSTVPCWHSYTASSSGPAFLALPWEISRLYSTVW